MNVHRSGYVTVDLDMEQKFRFETPTGPIMVEWITWWPSYEGSTPAGRMATVKGWGIRKDGSKAHIMRSGHMPVDELPLAARQGIAELLARPFLLAPLNLNKRD